MARSSWPGGPGATARRGIASRAPDGVGEPLAPRRAREAGPIGAARCVSEFLLCVLRLSPIKRVSRTVNPRRRTEPGQEQIMNERVRAVPRALLVAVASLLAIPEARA